MALNCREVFVTLVDPDGSTIIPFYCQLLGRSPDVDLPQRYVEFRLPGLRLGIFKPAVDQQSEFAQPSSGGMSLCFEVESLQVAIAHLTAIDAPMSEVRVASHGRELYAYDPLGNRLILHEASQ
jgi:hypothetical protein